MQASEELQEGLEEKLRQAMEAKEHVEQRMALLEKERQDLLQENIRMTEESHNLVRKSFFIEGFENLKTVTVKILNIGTCMSEQTV